MSKVKIKGHADGIGILTIEAPNTDTNRTLGIPDVGGTLLTDGQALPAIDGSALTGIDSLPTQTGQSGKYLTTDGTDSSWVNVTQTQGMIHAFTLDASTGNLSWTSGVTELFDSNLNDIYDSTIVGTDDMTFSVNNDGHLIMTIG